MVTALMPIIPAMAAEYYDKHDWNTAVGTENLRKIDTSVPGTVKLNDDVNIGTFVQLTSGSLTVNLNGHKLTRTGAGGTVFSVTGGELTIEDASSGEVLNSDTAESGNLIAVSGANSKLTINGGTFTHEVAETTQAIMATEGSSITLNDGTIKAPKTCLQVNDENSKLTINGGTIENTDTDGNAAIYVGLKGSFEMTDGEINTPVSAINVGGIKDGDKDNANLGTTATIGGNAVINKTGNGETTYGLLEVKWQSVLNIEDGATINGDVSVFKEGELNVNGGTIDNSGVNGGFAISTNGSKTGSDNESTGAKITINGGTIKGADDACGIYAPAGAWAIKGGEISGGAGIVVRGGKVAVTGGKITATNDGSTEIKVGDATKDGEKYAVPASGIVYDDAEYPEDKTDDGVPAVTVSGENTVVQAADGQPSVSYVEKGDTPTNSGKPTKESIKIEGGTYNSGTKADVAVSQYVDTAKGIDTTTGEIKPANEVTLQIIDFGYIDKMNDDDVNAAAKASGKFTSPAGITYTCSDWADATFYWSFNRALTADEVVTVTFTAPDGETTYTDKCENAAGGIRFATSFLNNTQLGDDDVAGFQTGKYTIGGQIEGGDTVEAIDDAKTATVNDLLPSIAAGAPVVAPATIGDKNGDIKDIVGAYDVKCSAKNSAGNYVIKGTAKALKSHTNGNDAEGYWFGVEIVAPDGVTLGTTYELTIDDQPKNSEVPVATFQNITEKPNAKGASIFFNTKGDGKETHTVKIKWDNDHAEATYIIDLTGVEHYVEPAPTVGVATIADKDGDITNVVTSPDVEYEAATNTIKATATDLKSHTNGADKEGNWFGIEIAAPTDVVKLGETYELTIDDQPTNPAVPVATNINGNPDTKGASIFFNVTDNEPASHTLKIKWSDSKEITYNVDLTGVELYEEPAPTVAAANIVDKSATPVTDVVKSGYKAECKNGTIVGTATDLKKHENDNNEKAYWFGVEIQAPADLASYTGTFDVTIDENEPVQSSFDDLQNVTTGNKKGVIIYFKSTGKADDKHTVTVKWGATSKTLTYDIDLSGVKHFVENPTVNVGNTTAGTASTDYTATVGKYEQKTGYKKATVTFTTGTGKKVPWNANGAGTNGNWVGITVVPPAGSTITGLATAATEALPTTFNEPQAAQGDSAELSGYYVDASQGITNKFFFVEITDTLSGVKTVYCYELTKGNPLELEAAPVTKYTVKIDSNIANGTVKADKTTAAEGETVTLTVTANSGYRFSSVTVKDADGKTVATTSASGKYTFTMPASNVTVTAAFRKSGGGGGGSSSGGGTSTHSVSTPSKTDNGSVSVSSKSAAKGSKVTITVKPEDGYKTGSVIVKDANGNVIEVTDNGDGTYSFIMPDTKVSIAAEFVKEDEAKPETSPAPEQTPAPGTEENCPSEKFTDVDQNQWYHEGIDYALTKGFMSGVGDTTFAPDADTTRAMIVAILYRLEGSPAVAAASFTDVPRGSWYADAVAWGEANGVVSGYNDELFGPNDSITREQMASILYRYAQYKGVDVSANRDLSGYSDAASVSDWAVTSLGWANAEGLITGMSDTVLAPTGTATRAQAAAILMRFCENIVK